MRIDHDLPCERCGYNLRTQAPDAVCPECGHAVADSADAFAGLLLADITRERLRRGARIAVVAASVHLGTMVFARLAAILFATAGMTLQVVLWVQTIIVGGLVVAGYAWSLWLLATPTPRDRAHPQADDRARQLRRHTIALAAVSVGCKVVGLVLHAAGAPIQAVIASFTLASIAGALVALVLLARLYRLARHARRTGPTAVALFGALCEATLLPASTALSVMTMLVISDTQWLGRLAQRGYSLFSVTQFGVQIGSALGALMLVIAAMWMRRVLRKPVGD